MLTTRIIVILIFIASVNNLFSQEGFTGGLTAGTVASQVDGDRLSGYNKAGFQGGIYILNRIDKRNGFRMEMKYIQKGSRSVSNPDSIYARYYKLRLNYIEVPFFYNYYLKKKFIFEGGIGFAYLFRAREDVDGTGFMIPFEPFFRFDFPYYLGVSYSVIDNFFINFRYSYSMAPIRKHPGNQYWYSDRGQYNNLVSFALYLNL